MKNYYQLFLPLLRGNTLIMQVSIVDSFLLISVLLGMLTLSKRKNRPMILIGMPNVLNNSYNNYFRWISYKSSQFSG